MKILMTAVFALSLVTACGGKSDEGDKKSAKPAFNAKSFKAIVATDVDGFSKAKSKATEDYASIRYELKQKNKAGQRADVKVSVSPCGGGCRYPSLEAWKSNKQKMHRPGAGARVGDGSTDFSGGKVFVFCLLELKKPGTRGANFCQLYHANGTNQTELTVSMNLATSPLSVKSKAELAKLMSHKEMIAAGKRVLEALVSKHF